MLDSETRRRIDNLRDILVGKLPGPESQVEQITTALIYKFMYDMDRESIELGGVPSFFVGDYEKYSWHHLFNPKLSGINRVKLYSEAIENMYTNPAAPPLFREIFKNSFLPFKDPSTLNMFLKEINEFHYSHSEKLGDAFEYLLSFMGSQGDAGQFRTPRHIIDFIVEIVNPKKNEAILDPSCGTAGFLISSYKHILKQNTSKKLGDRLTAEERKKLGDNLVGFDISPDMTRISLVNMYLHQFSSPRIYEYDTLSSEDRWNEYYDVILANPPFFSPKGGITPHSRFGIQATRAEVLFVDYIMEHLKPRGRAGIIVPEGIISRTEKAYKALRKKLVESNLVGVISLPTGVFQPYTSVKTFILILDKEHNLQRYIFFAKVENDGFSQGAQRNVIEKNDLPLILEGILTNSHEHPMIKWVSKEKIQSDGSTSLSIGRYIEQVKFETNFSIVPIIQLFEVISPPIKVKTREYLSEGKIPIVDQSSDHISGYWNNDDDKVTIDKPVVIFGDHTKVVKFINFDFVAGADGTKILRSTNNTLPKFLFYILKSISLPDLGYSRHFKELKEKEIPLPPIEIQKEIVEELEGYQKIIDGCRQVVENYKPIIDIDLSWEFVKLGDLFDNITETVNPELIQNSDYMYVGLEHIGKGTGDFDNGIYPSKNKIKSNKNKFESGDILYGKLRPNLNKVVNVDFNGICSTDILVLRGRQSHQALFYKAIFLSDWFNNEVMRGVSGAQLPRTSYSFIRTIQIPCPPLEVQFTESEKLRLEKTTLEGMKKLIEIYTQKIQDRMSKVLGENSQTKV